MSAPADQVFDTQKIEVDKPPYVTIEFFDKYGEVFGKHDAIRPYAKTIRVFVPDDYSHHLPITAKFTEHPPEEAEDNDVDPPHPSEAKPAAAKAPEAKPAHIEHHGDVAQTQPPNS